MTTETRNASQEALAIGLGAIAGFVCLPANTRKASGWLTNLAHAVTSWGYVRMPEQEFIEAFYEALDDSGFMDHLRRCVADRESLADSSPFEVTPGSLDELLTAMAADTDEGDFVFD